MQIRWMYANEIELGARSFHMCTVDSVVSVWITWKAPPTLYRPAGTQGRAVLPLSTNNRGAEAGLSPSRPIGGVESRDVSSPYSLSPGFAWWVYPRLFRPGFLPSQDLRAKIPKNPINKYTVETHMWQRSVFNDLLINKCNRLVNQLSGNV